MSDHSELKRLALACGNLNWRFLTEKLTEYGIRDDHGYIAFLPVGHPAKYGACPEREAKARFLGAMTPAVVLGLLAEIEALKNQVERAGTDEIPDFGGGSGNKARRRAGALGIDYESVMGKGGQS